MDPSYYSASDGNPSKTPKDTLFLEGALGVAHGGLYGGGGNATSISEAANLGYQQNFRLDNGHLIVSPEVYVGARHETDWAGGPSNSQWSAMIGCGIGISFAPRDKKPDD